MGIGKGWTWMVVAGCVGALSGCCCARTVRTAETTVEVQTTTAPAPAPKEEKAGEMAGMDMSITLPSAEHERFQALVGTWKVSGEFWMEPGQEPMKMVSTATFELLLGGRYLKQTVKGQPFFPGAEPFEGLGIVGYDRIAKQYHSTWFDNMGTGVMSETGQASADGTTVTMTGSGDFGMGPMTFREVHTRVSDDEFTMEMYSKDATHPEVKVMRLVYTR